MIAELVPVWRRPGCDTRCWRGVVLVVGERQTRTVEVHDADAHEDYIREALGTAAPKTYRGVLQIGPLRIDWRNEMVSVLTMPVTDLKRRERSVLFYLVGNPGRIVLFAEIIEAVWGREYVGGSTQRLREAISGIRRKLWEAAPLIETVRGEGYRMRFEVPEGV